MIETVARKPWVLHHKVGMVGISYGGISQLFVAATRPPSLAAITPLSVIDDTQTTLHPGGILNTGFALSWATDRVRDAKPASATGGQRWALDRIRAGDRETFVQSGWLRASMRKLGRRRSTPLAPVLSLRARDAAPLPKGGAARITVPLYYQGHVYRAGSRIRVTISAPGGDQPVWAFARTRPHGRPSVSILRGTSRLVLPVVDGVDVPTGLPPCPGLRGEPCRTYTGR